MGKIHFGNRGLRAVGHIFRKIYHMDHMVHVVHERSATVQRHRHLKVLLTNLPTNSPGVGEGARDASKNAKYNRLDQPREV